MLPLPAPPSLTAHWPGQSSRKSPCVGSERSRPSRSVGRERARGSQLSTATRSGATETRGTVLGSGTSRHELSRQGGLLLSSPGRHRVQNGGKVTLWATTPGAREGGADTKDIDVWARGQLDSTNDITRGANSACDDAGRARPGVGAGEAAAVGVCGILAGAGGFYPLQQGRFAERRQSPREAPAECAGLSTADCIKAAKRTRRLQAKRSSEAGSR